MPTTSTETSDSLSSLREIVLRRSRGIVESVKSQASDYLSTVVSNNPLLTSDEVLSRDDVKKFLDHIVSSSQKDVSSLLQGSYQAGSRLGTVSAKREIARHHLFASGVSAPTESSYLDSVISDSFSRISDLRSVFEQSVHSAFLTESPGPAWDKHSHTGVHNIYRATALQRAQSVRDGIDLAARRWSVSVQSAASVVPVRAVSEGQSAVYSDVSTRSGVKLGKKWRTTSIRPCSLCKALNGTVVSIDSMFDGSLSADTRHRPSAVYFNLSGPPRHPLCQCVQDLVVLAEEETESNQPHVVSGKETPPPSSSAVPEPTAEVGVDETSVTPTEETRQEIVREEKAIPVLDLPRFLSSREIRQMPASRYLSLVSFLRSLVPTVKALWRKVVRRG
jgi:hypothetical protein